MLLARGVIMIDKELIKKAIEAKQCRGILAYMNCPVDEYSWKHSRKDYDGIRSIIHGLRPRSIRIMQEWINKQGD
jgi:hypothetical protein